ncbi:hypothetical protein TELCIR_24854 [Teladorsagia circumcincta]|uniref:AB hydrolase-1 domain-containing protein n=1 Tax=Teladorsagia circumcincta TaxID=45464 RepID=A0A2G9T749_TELCI|nr:hypothetical protein TELCIR_24854 [Teladorsagia circumcincta]
MVKTGSVAMFDHGEAKNLAAYGQKAPPAYEFSNMNITKVPVYLFTGGNDRLADDDDIKGYLLPHIGSVVKLNTHLPQYNHLDFIWGVQAAADVYKPIVSYIKDSLASKTADRKSSQQ